MKKFLGILIVSVLFVFIGCSTKQKVQEQVSQTTSQALNVDISKSVASINSNYTIIESATGVTLYKHKTKDIYVQKISKSKMLFNVNYEQNIDLTFNTYFIEDKWNNLLKNNSKIFSIVNISFFAFKPLNESTPTTLPYGLKVNSKVLTNGYGKAGTENMRQLLLIDDRNSLGLVPYADSLFNNSKFPYAMVGLNVDYDIDKDSPNVGRNFMGQNGEDFIIVNGNGTQLEMVSILNEFGITDKRKMIMFDGSGSSQLKTSSNSFYGKYNIGKRKIPVTLSIIRKN